MIEHVFFLIEQLGFYMILLEHGDFIRKHGALNPVKNGDLIGNWGFNQENRTTNNTISERFGLAQNTGTQFRAIQNMHNDDRQMSRRYSCEGGKEVWEIVDSNKGTRGFELAKVAKTVEKLDEIGVPRNHPMIFMGFFIMDHP